MRDIANAAIIINGHTLTPAEAATLRVAVCAYLSELEHLGLGEEMDAQTRCQRTIQTCAAILGYLFASYVSPSPEGDSA